MDTLPRLTRVAEAYQTALPESILTTLAETLSRVEETLNRLPEGPQPEVPPLLRPPAATPHPPPSLSGRLTAREALARAGPAAEGGAYTFIDLTAGEGRPHPGPLAGVPVAVKDLMAVAGRPISACSAVRRDAPPEPADAEVVARLRAAGAVVIGTAALHEFAFGVTGINEFCGTTLNPRHPDRIAGGSSSGSAAAVAEGSALVALGTDTGGSVRIPAALCGVVGFKPSLGTYSTRGVFPLSPTLDHVGLLAPSVQVVTAVHAALGHPVPQPRQPTRLGVLWHELERCQPEVRSRLEAALRLVSAAGCELVEVPWPEAEEVFAASTAIMFAEAAAVHRAEMARDATRYGQDVRARLVMGLALSAVTYLQARRARRRLRAEVLQALSRVDAVLGPTVGRVAPKVREARDPRLAAELVAFTRLANVAGVPALSLPVPGDGLPVGLQITCATDMHALSVAAWLEATLQPRP